MESNTCSGMGKRAEAAISEEAESLRRADLDTRLKALRAYLHKIPDAVATLDDAISEINRQHQRAESHHANLLRTERDWAEMKMQRDKVRTALEQWKCPSCGGTGNYLNKSQATGEYRETTVPCSKCAGIGLHPTAISALNATEPLKGEAA